MPKFTALQFESSVLRTQHEGIFRVIWGAGVSHGPMRQKYTPISGTVGPLKCADLAEDDFGLFLKRQAGVSMCPKYK